MVDVERVLDDAGLTNPHVREYVAHWAGVTGAERVEVVSASDDARLIQEALDAGELLPAGEGRYYSRSYYKDTARSEERTIVATSDENDKGVYNNWKPAAEMKPKLVELMTGASAGKTMYVIPYLMSPKGSPVEIAVGYTAPDRVRIEVRDHGEGIDADQQEKVFERFYRTDASRARSATQGGGAGLGLSIAASIVEQHRGSIGVTGTEGGGATFWVELQGTEIAPEAQVEPDQRRAIGHRSPQEPTDD